MNKNSVEALTLVLRLNFKLAVDIHLKSIWLIVMLFQDQQWLIQKHILLEIMLTKDCNN